MPEQYDPRKLPVAVGLPVETELLELAKPTPRTRLWPKILLVSAIGVASYLLFFFFRGPNDEAASVPNPPPAPGYTELSSCTETESLDGKKTLSLTDNSEAVLTEEGNDGKNHTITGNWSFDAGLKRYAVTLNGETTEYSIVSLERIGICILVKGDVGAADLRASWFASSVDDDPGDDREPDTPGP